MKTETPLTNGLVFETVFHANPRPDSPFKYRATHMQGQRAPKVILSNDSRIPPGRPCKVRITSIKKPASKDHGHVEVDYVGKADFRLDGSVYVDPLLALKLQALLENGLNVLLDGPQGCGKTVLSREVAEALEMDYVYFNCSAVYEATDFIATLQLKAAGTGQSETVWTPTDIYRAIEAARDRPERRFLVFLDEFNRCREMARNGIVPALDTTQKLFNPMTGSLLDIPDNIFWIAAVNNGAQFTGTTLVDPAHLDRFAPLQIDYPPAGEEIRILAERYPHVPHKEVVRIVQVANAVRHDPNARFDLSMRATEEACLVRGHPNFAGAFEGDPLPEILKTSFCARFSGRWNEPGSDAGVVWKIVAEALNKSV